MLTNEQIKTFFNLLDCYLVGDINTFLREDIMSQRCGGCCFPAIQTIASGMELLGLLMFGGNYLEIKKDTDRNFRVFKDFWNNYMVKKSPDYKIITPQLFRDSVRNPIAHFSFVRRKVFIMKEGEKRIWVEEGFLKINLPKLASDFLSCYFDIRNVLLDEKNIKTISIFSIGYKILEGESSKTDSEIAKLI